MITKFSRAIRSTPTSLKNVESQLTRAHKILVKDWYLYSSVTPTEVGSTYVPYIEKSFVVRGN